MMSMKMGSRRDCEEEDPILFAMRLATASVLPSVLKVAIELDILELIKKKGPNAFISPAELAAQIPTTNPDAHKLLDRLLRLLATNSILHCTLKTLPDGRIERLYALAPVCYFFTKNDDGVSMAPLLLMNQDKAHMQTWSRVKDAILEGGIPFNKEHGMNAFEYAAKDPRFNKIFNETMFNTSTILMKRVLDIYDGFQGLESLVDVGGGIGASLAMIVSKYPSIKGINFDLPHVIRDAPSYNGIEHMGGDMFVSMPKGDAIFMKWILHDWSDEDCLKILKNCHKTLPEKGKVIIVERILSDNPNKGVISDFHVDAIMLACTPGGKERTEKELEALAKQAGFKQFRKVCYALPLWIIELCK